MAACYGYTDGSGEIYASRHEAIANTNMPTEVYYVYTPSDELMGLDWLSFAGDVEIGMDIVIQEGDDVERYPITDVVDSEEGTTIHYRINGDTVGKHTVEEVNESERMVIV